MTDELCNLIGHALDGGTLCIYDGESGQAHRLATLIFGRPAFQRAKGRMAEAAPIQTAIADATGTAKWYRCFTTDGRELLNGPVAAKGDNGLVISSTDIQHGADISVDHYVIGVS